MSRVPPAGSPNRELLQGSYLAVSSLIGLHQALLVHPLNPLACHAQVRLAAWSPIGSLAGLSGPQERFCCGQSLLRIV